MTTVAETDFTDLEKTYYSVENFLKMKTKRMIQIGIDPDEAWSACHISFMNAVRTWKPDKGTKFTTWLGWWIDGEMSWFRKRRSAKRYQPTVELADHHSKKETNHFLSELMDSLNSDGRQIVSICLHPPDCVAKQNCLEPNPIPYRNRLRDYLRKTGWEEDRIRRGFEQISISLIS